MSGPVDPVAHLRELSATALRAADTLGVLEDAEVGLVISASDDVSARGVTSGGLATVISGSKESNGCLKEHRAQVGVRRGQDGGS